MSEPRKLHVISFNVPLPANYGGVIDVFYKIKALHNAGVKIILHNFTYGRNPASELEQYAEEVHYYARASNPWLLFGSKPYIVSTRQSQALRERLLQDKHPILMEGLHSTGLLSDPAFASRRMVVRTHNVEHDYYAHLARVEKKVWKRFYLQLESRRLRRYESILKSAYAVAAISPEDQRHFASIHSRSFYLPAFHPFDQLTVSESVEDFAFYHGNLAVGENNEAALFLVEQVFSRMKHMLKIAGSNPSDELRKAVAKTNNVILLDDLSPEEIHRHIACARVNVLPTFQSTGIKLKLLAALFLGRPCIVNTPMVAQTGLESLCTIVDSPEEFVHAIQRACSTGALSSDYLSLRQSMLETGFSNRKNAEVLIQQLF